MKSLIWDLDGTLVHSAPDIQAAANKMLADFDLAPLDLATIETFIGNGIPKLVERCLAVYDLPLNDAAIQAMRSYYDADCTTLTAPYAGVLNCLETMKSRGIKMALCTNKPLAPALIILEALDLAKYFDVTVGGDTYAHHKPHPAPLLGCVEQLGVNVADCIYIGDSETDTQTAINGNMTFALFSGGYRKTPVLALKHDFLFDHFDALTEYLS